MGESGRGISLVWRGGAPGASSEYGGGGSFSPGAGAGAGAAGLTPLMMVLCSVIPIVVELCYA